MADIFEDETEAEAEKKKALAAAKKASNAAIAEQVPCVRACVRLRVWVRASACVRVRVWMRAYACVCVRSRV